MKKGIDTLALNKYVKLVREELPQNWYYSSFMRTFGDARKAIFAVASEKRAGGFRGQSIWEDDHEYNSSKHDKLILRDLKFHNNLKQKFPELDVQFSFFCEHNIKGDALKRIVDKCLSEARGVTIVNSVWQGDLIRDGSVVNEIHGSKHRAPKGVYNFSYDGQNAFDSDVASDLKKYKDADVFFMWCPQLNAKFKLEDKTPRPLRVNTVVDKHFDAMIALFREKGKTKLDNRFIYKKVSDQHTPVPSSKDCKPVIIAPVKAKEIKLVADNNQVIHSLKYFGTFTGGGYRYYATDWGFEIAEKAKRIQGHPVVRVMIGEQSYGTVNPSFRENSYRV